MAWRVERSGERRVEEREEERMDEGGGGEERKEIESEGREEGRKRV